MTQAAVDLPDYIKSVSGPANVIFDASLNMPPTPVTQYQSVIVQLFNLDSTSPIVAQYFFRDASGSTYDSGVLTSEQVTSQVAFSLPVMASTLAIVNSTGNQLLATVIGLPTRLPRRTLFDGQPFRTFQGVIPSGSPSGTRFRLPGVGMSLDAHTPDNSSYNGQTTFSFNVSALGGATAWSLIARARRADGTTVDVTMFSVTAPGFQTFNLGHPFGFVAWIASNSGATTANVTATLNVYPAENP